jgi:PAS domain S-box-containing protein
MITVAPASLDACLWLAQTIDDSDRVEEIYAAALDALRRGLGVERSSILLFDPDGVMRFKAARGLSPAYQQAVEGHTPWRPDTPNPQPMVVSDVTAEPALSGLLPIIQGEGIAAMAFVPLVSRHRVIGKFMMYFDRPVQLGTGALELAGLIAAQVAFAVERTRAGAAERRAADRLRFALDAAQMGTFEWDLSTNRVAWSDNLAAIHGLPAGAFDGSFDSYQQEIHPDDRDRVLQSARRAAVDGTAHEAEYRIVSPDGTVRWVEGKGRVECDADGRPIRMHGVCMNVTRRKEAELARLETLQEASRLKDEFLAVLSHELRTPLNAIVGWVRLVQSNVLPPERIAGAIEVIHRNAMLQAQLIDQLLDVSRIITGKLRIDRTPLAVGELIDRAISAIRPAALAKHLTLTMDVAPQLPPVDGDGERLLQVLGNLLSNSVKFTNDGGAIRMRAAVRDDRVVIEVEDTGCGIAPEFLPMVFERFRQADASPTRRHGGLGLGLAIAKHLVELHGGSIAARSAGHDAGTTIEVRLPAATLRPDVPVKAAVSSSLLVSESLAGLRVLVVDDDGDARALLQTLFARYGAEVGSAADVEAALVHLRTVDCDVVVADIAMPNVDGYGLIRLVRAAGPRPRAIALTACARPEDRHRALEEGFDAFSAKPFDPDELVRTVQQLGRLSRASLAGADPGSAIAASGPDSAHPPADRPAAARE